MSQRRVTDSRGAGLGPKYRCRDWPVMVAVKGRAFGGSFGNVPFIRTALTGGRDWVGDDQGSWRRRSAGARFASPSIVLNRLAPLLNQCHGPRTIRLFQAVGHGNFVASSRHGGTGVGAVVGTQSWLFYYITPPPFASWREVSCRHLETVQMSLHMAKLSLSMMSFHC